MEHDARYLESLAEKMGQMPSRGGALFQNIQNGGRQSLTSVSKPMVNTKLAAKVRYFLDHLQRNGSSAMGSRLQAHLL